MTYAKQSSQRYLHKFVQRHPGGYLGRPRRVQLFGNVLHLLRQHLGKDALIDRRDVLPVRAIHIKSLIAMRFFSGC